MRELPAGMRVKMLAAAELFAEFGLDATKMEDIAAATGVPKATLYYYFAGKEDILTFLFNEILDEIARATDNALTTKGNGADRLRAAMVTICAFSSNTLRPVEPCSSTWAGPPARHLLTSGSKKRTGDPFELFSSRVPKTAASVRSNTHA